MVKGLASVVLGIFFVFCFILTPVAQESPDSPDPIIEEDLTPETHDETAGPHFITAEVLKAADIEPAIIYYIRDDVNKKFSGLITNLKLEKIYGVSQEGITAAAYFDYSYTSIRNKENTLYEKGKMTFIKFNSGKWFNTELSIYLMDSYPLEPNTGNKLKEKSQR